MTEAPNRIWATINGARSVLPGTDQYLIGGWEGAPREHGREYILAAEHHRIVAEKDAEIEAAYARGFHDAQEKAMVEGRLVVEDSAEIARLTAERDTIAALTVELCAKCCDDEADKCDDAVKWGGAPKYIANCKAAAYAMRDRAAAIRYLSKQAEKE